MSESGLPEGWEVCVSRSRDLPYYYHSATSTSSWEPPAGSNIDVLKDFVQTHFANAKGNQKVRASHLLVKHNESRRPSSWKTPNITRSKEEAKSILLGHEARIRSGAASLGELAQTESDCSSAKRGGDLGYFGKGEMQKEFEDAAFKLKPGEVSRIIETNSGYHLIERTA